MINLRALVLAALADCVSYLVYTGCLCECLCISNENDQGKYADTYILTVNPHQVEIEARNDRDRSGGW